MNMMDCQIVVRWECPLDSQRLLDSEESDIAIDSFTRTRTLQVPCKYVVLKR